MFYCWVYRLNYLGPPVHSSGAISISSRPVEMPFVSVCVCDPKANKSTINLKHVNVEGLLFTKNCLSPHTNWFDYIVTSPMVHINVN